MSYIDPNGLEVTGTFNSTTGQLTITDNDSGRTATANKAFSGDPSQNYSPAPKRTYSIRDFPWGRSLQDHYFALLRHDERLDDYADGFPSNYQCDRPDQQCTMSGLRLHAGFASHGCVTVPGLPDSEPWASIQDILDNTARGDPIEIGGRSYPNYGTLTITDKRDILIWKEEACAES